MSNLFAESLATDLSNICFGYPNRVDEAVLSSSVAWQATLPLTHLQDRVLSRVARSTGVGIDPDIAADLGRARRIGAVALARHNLSVGARVRVRGDDAVDMTTPIYDSGWVDVWPAGMIPLELLEWEEDNFWLGTVSEETRAGYRAPFVHLFDAVYAQYWRIDISDPLNADGWVQVGRLVIADTWVPEVNYSYGAQLGFEDRSVVAETLGGTEYFDERAKYRSQRLVLDWLTEAEALTSQLDMQRLLGVTRELLVVPNPADLANQPRTAFLARVQRLAPIERNIPGVFRTVIEVKELL